MLVSSRPHCLLAVNPTLVLDLEAGRQLGEGNLGSG